MVFFLSQDAAKWQRQAGLEPMSIRRTDKGPYDKQQSTRIVLTRWLLQLAFCLTACVHIWRALNHSVHKINSLCASSSSLMTNQTGEFPPKYRTCCKQDKITGALQRRTSQNGNADKTGHFLAWGDQGAWWGAFLGTWGPANKWLPNKSIHE